MLWAAAAEKVVTEEVIERAEVNEQEKFVRTPRALPNIWPDMRPKPKALVVTDDDQFARQAKGYREGDRVLVETHGSFKSRRAEVRFVGHVPEIRPGYWVGVVYDEPCGKNDGSIFGARYFDCEMMYGGFVRPNVIKRDPRPPKSTYLTPEQIIEQKKLEELAKKKGKKGREAIAKLIAMGVREPDPVDETAAAEEAPAEAPAEAAPAEGGAPDATVAADTATGADVAMPDADAAAAGPSEEQQAFETSVFDKVSDFFFGAAAAAQDEAQTHADGTMVAVTDPQATHRKGNRRKKGKASWEDAMARSLTGLHLVDEHDDGAVQNALDRRRQQKLKAKANWLVTGDAALRDKKIAAAKASVAKGPGLNTSIVRQLGTFTITAHDDAGNRRLTGGELIAVAIRGTSNVRPRLIDNGDGSYTCSYRAWVSGTYEVAIWLNGEQLGESPYALEVLSTRAEATKCELRGKGLSSAVSREPAAFEIEYVDAFGQVCYAEDLDVYVELVYSPRVGLMGGNAKAIALIKERTQQAQLAQAEEEKKEKEEKKKRRKSLAPGMVGDKTQGTEAELPDGGRRSTSPTTTNTTSPTISPSPTPSPMVAPALPSDGKPAQLTIESFLAEGGGVPVDPDKEGKTHGRRERRMTILPQNVVTLLPPSLYQRLDAIERQQHMQLWARRRAMDQAKQMMDSQQKKPGMIIKKHKALELDQALNYDHELKADKKGVGFAYGGVSPGTLHAKGQLIRVHTVHFSVGLAGRYRLHVGLRQQAVPLPGSPFELEVSPGGAYAPSTKLPAETLPLRGVVGESWRGMVMFASDKVGNQCVKGGAKVEIDVNSEDVEAVCTDNGDGSYGFRWRSERAGTYSVSIMIDGMPVIGSPTTLTMLAATLDVSNCDAGGAGLKDAIAGLPAVLRVTCKDQYSNPATPATSLKFGLAITQMEGAEHAKKKKLAEGENAAPKTRQQKQIEREEEMRERKKRIDIDRLKSIPFEGLWVDGEYEIRYAAQKAGDHQLHVWADPDGKGAREVLPGSPFTLHVVENEPTASKSNVGYPQDEKKTIYAGERLILRPQLRDEFGNASAAPPEAVTASVDTPDGSQPLAVKPSNKGLGQYEVICETALKGEYTMHVYLNGEPIEGSPGVFFVDPAVPMAGKSKLNPPVEPPITHKPCELILNTVDKLGNTLDRGGARIDVRIIGANASTCTTVDRKDGTYSLTFTAGAVGEYRIMVRVDNTEMSPLTLQFAEGERVQTQQSQSFREDSPGAQRRNSITSTQPLVLQSVVDAANAEGPLEVAVVDLLEKGEPASEAAGGDKPLNASASMGSQVSVSSSKASAKKAKAGSKSGGKTPSGGSPKPGSPANSQRAGAAQKTPKSGKPSPKK